MTLLLITLSACGGGSGNAVDAGVDDGGADGGEDAPAPPAPPALPALPAFAPCPAGWRAVADADDADVVTCDPWPKSGHADCPEDSAHFPGGAGCERIGTACPAGDFAADLPAGVAVIYVRAGAAAGGDGTIGAPYARIGDGIAAAPDGAIVAVSKGTFDEAVLVGRPVTVWGACVAETIVASSSPSGTVGSLSINVGGAVVKNLSVSGARLGLQVRNNRSVATVESVLVRGATKVGVDIYGGAHLEATDLVVRDVLAAPDGTYGMGLQVQGGSVVTIERLVVERARLSGITVAETGTSVEISDAAVLDTQTAGGGIGDGMQAIFGGSVTLHRAVFEGNRGYGVQVLDAGTTLSAEDLVVRDTQSLADATLGVGLDLQGSTAELDRATFDGNRMSGIVAGDPGSSLVARDLVVRDTLVQESDLVYGNGILTGPGLSADWTRVFLARNRSYGVQALGAGSNVHVEDLTIVDMRSRDADREYGYGFYVAETGHAEIVRVLVERSIGTAVTANQPGTTLVCEDLTVRDTAPWEPSGDWGYGFAVERGAAAELRRAEVERSHGAGVLVNEDATLVAEDLTVRDTQAQQSNGQFGMGLQVGYGSTATVTRALFDGNKRDGVFAVDESAMTLSDLVVTSTIETDCAAEGCPDPGGRGVAIAGTASGTVARFRISDSALCGVQLTGAGTLDLSQGVVSHNRIGVNVQNESFDITRLQDHVLFLDNEVDFDGSTLPVPAAIGSVTP